MEKILEDKIYDHLERHGRISFFEQVTKKSDGQSSRRGIFAFDKVDVQKVKSTFSSRCFGEMELKLACDRRQRGVFSTKNLQCAVYCREQWDLLFSPRGWL